MPFTRLRTTTTDVRETVPVCLPALKISIRNHAFSQASNTDHRCTRDSAYLPVYKPACLENQHLKSRLLPGFEHRPHMLVGQCLPVCLSACQPALKISIQNYGIYINQNLWVILDKLQISLLKTLFIKLLENFIISNISHYLLNYSWLKSNFIALFPSSFTEEYYHKEI